MIVASLLPLLPLAALALVLGYFFRAPVVAWVGALIASTGWLNGAVVWFEGFRADSLRSVLAVVATWVTPSMVTLVARRRWRPL